MPGPAWDGARALKLHAVLLLALPPGLVVGPMGGAGQPATLVGLGCGLWWVFHHVSRASGTRWSRQPVRLGFVAFACAVGASYVAATIRPIEPAEYSTLTLGVLFVLSWGGVLLVANDGIPDGERLLSVARVLVFLGGAMALLGIVQFLTSQVWVDKIQIPGLVANHGVFGLTEREGFTRPAGTASHPIEYGAVLTMILPVALALAMGDTRRSLVVRWTPFVLMAACVPLSISRSALLSGALGILVVMAAWPRQRRVAGFVVLVVSAVATFLLVPGMLGSLLGLFTRVGGDSSAASRVGSYAIAGDFIERAPLFGRGFSTFLPSYRILDNQYLGLTIETGIVGLVAFSALILSGVFSARAAERSATDETQQQLARGLGAGVLAGALTMALFDGLSFAMAAAMLFLMIGLSGAARRVHSRPAEPEAESGEPAGLATTDVVAIVVRRWYIAVCGAGATGLMLLFVLLYPGVYTAQAVVVFLAPVTDSHPNVLESTSDDVIATAGLVERLVNRGVDAPATTSVVSLVGRGVRNGWSVVLPNSGGQWTQNYIDSQLLVQVTGPTAEEVSARAEALVGRVRATTADIQQEAGVGSRWMITTKSNSDAPAVRLESGHRARALLVTAALGGFLSVAACVQWHLWRRRRR